MNPLCLIILFVATCLLYDFYEKTQKRALLRSKGPKEAIDFDEKSFFLTNQNSDTKNSTLRNGSNETPSEISNIECIKSCPEKYIMSVDCEYCFLFGEWFSKSGGRMSLMVEKDYA